MIISLCSEKAIWNLGAKYIVYVKCGLYVERKITLPISGVHKIPGSILTSEVTLFTELSQLYHSQV